jgi:hypothetical protein
MAELSRLIDMFESAEQATSDSRAESERARDYYDDKQLTEEEISALGKRRQPPVVENLVKPKVDGLCGLERQTRTDPVCYPRTYGDDEAAQVATDALRYVADDQKLDMKRSQVFNNMLVEGLGGVEIIAEQVRGAIDPKIVPIAWDRIFADPHSSQPDYSDASYLGFQTWMDEEDANARWPDKKELIAATIEKPARSADTFDDKPRWQVWADKKRKRLRVSTVYYKEQGEWFRAVYTLAGELEPCEPSPWLDEDGKPECGLVIQSAYVDRDNNRYGIVRGMFSLQDEVNKRRSKYLHLINTRQLRMSRSHEGNKNELRKEIARPDGIVFADKDELEVISTNDLSVGNFNLLQEAKAALQGIGPNAHMQGKEGKDQSGRAILAMQQAGMTEMAPLLDALRDFNMRVYRAVWNRIRQFWTTERWVRVTDDEKAVKFFAVNTTAAAKKIIDAANKKEIDHPTAQQYLGQVKQAAEMGMLPPDQMQPANVLAELDIDIQIDEVVNTPTLHAEQFEMLSQAISSGILGQPPSPEYVKMWLMASTFRNKAEMIAVLDEQQEQQGQMGQQQQQLAQAHAEAEVGLKQAQGLKTMAEAEGQVIENEMAPAQAVVDAQSQGFNEAA